LAAADLPEHERVVHQRRKEVDRLHDGQVGAQAEHARVVERFRADEQIGMRDRRQLAQHLRGRFHGKLARSAGATGVVGQPDLAAFAHARELTRPLRSGPIHPP